MKSYGKLGFDMYRLLAGAISLGIVLFSGGMVQAAPQYTITCDFCHRMPPLDSPTGTRDAATGAIKGNHQEHAGTPAASCVKCHGDAVTVYPTGHRTKSIHVQGNINNSPAVGAYSRTFFNQTSVPPNPLGTCANVNCHFESVTPFWGSSVFLSSGDCSRCHGIAPGTGNHPVIGSKHGSYYGTGTGSCQKCHPDHASESKPFSHATSAANRGIVVRFTSAPNSGGTYSGNGLNYLPSQNKVTFGNCTNLYCHSNGVGGAPNVVPTWGGSLDCRGCHNSTAASGAPMVSGKHGAHVNNAAILGVNYNCAACHAKTVSNDTTIADVTRHVNGFTDFSGAKAGRNYNSGTGVCSIVYCHSDGKSTYKDMAATGWKSSVTLDCKGCHGSDTAPAFSSTAGEPNYANGGAGQLRANTHQAHVSGATDCINCHVNTVDGTGKLTGSSHTNGSIDVNFNFPKAGTNAMYTAATRTCSSLYCHSNGTSVATVQPASGSVVWGSNKLACDGCHGNPPAYANNTPKANSHANHNFGCGTCHAGTTTDGVTIINKSLHANGVYNVTPVAGITFTYTYASTGGTCSNVNCHLGVSASWGSNVNHIANLGSGDIQVFQNTTNHEDGQEVVHENCALCHYANIVVQHNYDCSICHAGANPAGALIGHWDKTCQSGSCHPSIHANTDHDAYVNVDVCTNCHSVSNPWGTNAVTGDNCAWCHSPQQTLSVFIQQHPSACANGPVRIAGGSLINYPDFLSAYAQAADTNVILLQAVIFTSDFVLNKNLRLTLDGGFDCGYTTNAGTTTMLLGNLRVQNGTVNIDKLRFR